MLSFDLSNLATGKIKHLFTQQFQDDHVVLAEALTGPAGSHNIADERWPVLRPLLFQDLQREAATHETHGKGTDFTVRFKMVQTLAYLNKNHIQFSNIHFLFLEKEEKSQALHNTPPPSSSPESSSLTSTHVGSDEVLIIRPTTYFLIPAEEVGIYFQLCQISQM